MRIFKKKRSIMPSIQVFARTPYETCQCAPKNNMICYLHLLIHSFYISNITNCLTMLPFVEVAPRFYVTEIIINFRGTSISALLRGQVQTCMPIVPAEPRELEARLNRLLWHGFSDCGSNHGFMGTMGGKWGRQAGSSVFQKKKGSSSHRRYVCEVTRQKNMARPVQQEHETNVQPVDKPQRSDRTAF